MCVRAPDVCLQDPQFVMYDFNKPEELPAHLHHTFDAVVIDPVSQAYMHAECACTHDGVHL